MTMNNGALPPEAAALSVPSRETAYTETIKCIARALRTHEQVWIVSEQYDAEQIAWLIDLVRRGPHGRWVRQRYRFDAQSETLHFRGEQAVDAAEPARARSHGKPFPIGLIG